MNYFSSAETAKHTVVATVRQAVVEVLVVDPVGRNCVELQQPCNLLVVGPDMPVAAWQLFKFWPVFPVWQLVLIGNIDSCQYVVCDDHVVWVCQFQPSSQIVHVRQTWQTHNCFVWRVGRFMLQLCNFERTGLHCADCAAFFCNMVGFLFYIKRTKRTKRTGNNMPALPVLYKTHTHLWFACASMSSMCQCGNASQQVVCPVAGLRLDAPGRLVGLVQMVCRHKMG